MIKRFVKYKYAIEMPPKVKEVNEFISDILTPQKISDLIKGKIRLYISPILEEIDDYEIDKVRKLMFIPLDFDNKTGDKNFIKEVKTAYKDLKSNFIFFSTLGVGYHAISKFIIDITDKEIKDVKLNLLSKGFNKYKHLDFSIVRDTPFLLYGYDPKTQKVAKNLRMVDIGKRRTIMEIGGIKKEELEMVLKTILFSQIKKI